MLTVVPSARSRLSVLPAGTVNELMFTVAHSTASSTSSKDAMVPVHARAAGRAMTAPANTSSAERRTNVGDILRLVRRCRGRDAFAALVADEARERSAVEQRRAGAYMLVLRINIRDMREGEGVVRRVMRCCEAQLSYVEHMPMRTRRWEARRQTRRREKDHHDAGVLQRGLVTMHRRPARGSHRPTGNLGSGQQHGRTYYRESENFKLTYTHAEVSSRKAILHNRVLPSFSTQTDADTKLTNGVFIRQSS